jgi:hypothetical protein
MALVLGAVAPSFLRITRVMETVLRRVLVMVALGDSLVLTGPSFLAVAGL